MNLFSSSKKERPFLKLCEKCHGKGQLSFYNNQQEKVYDACGECSKGTQGARTLMSSRYSLGVKLKCTCKTESASYDWVLGHQSKHLPQSQPEIRALLKLQAELSRMGTPGNALLLACDCGAHYLCVDGEERKKISGETSQNEADKEHNKQLAEALVMKGIHRKITPSETM